MFYDFRFNEPEEHKDWYVNSTYEEDDDDNGLLVSCNEENSCNQNNAIFVNIQDIIKITLE